MPTQQEEAVIEIASPDSSISITPYIPSPSPSEHSTSHGSDSDSGVHLEDTTSVNIYGRIPIPPEQNLRDLLIKVTETNNLASVTQVKLQVIAVDVCLQHINIHLPQLTDLNLEGSVLSSLRDLGCGLNNLKSLRVSRCGLTSLDGLFGLQSLEELYAPNNTIEDLSPCTFLPNIKHIDLKRNRIKDLTTVSFLSLCTTLEHLELDENEELIEIPEYRQIVKGLLPDLKTLDGIDLANEKPFRPCKKSTKKLDSPLLQNTSTGSEKEDNITPTTTQSTKNSNPALRRFTALEGSFTVRFTPKVLSPRPSSGSSSDSNLISSYEYELLNSQQKPSSEDNASDNSKLN